MQYGMQALFLRVLEMLFEAVDRVCDPSLLLDPPVGDSATPRHPEGGVLGESEHFQTRPCQRCLGNAWCCGSVSLEAYDVLRGRLLSHYLLADSSGKSVPMRSRGGRLHIDVVCIVHLRRLFANRAGLAP